jgi:hypothetical protein
LAITSGIATTLSGNGLDTSSFVIEVGTSRYNQNAALDINSFIVYIEEVSTEPDTETVRYYVQSKPVSGTNNAMVMEIETEENYASSIFYHAGNKLLSYDKGT